MHKPFMADTHFKNDDYTKNPLVRADYEECTFESCQFQDGFLDNQNFVDCVFNNCDFSNCNITNTIFNEVLFKKCKLVGVQFEKANSGLLSLGFLDCNLTLTSFYGMQIQKTNFSGSNLSQADFTETDLTEVDFSYCNLHNTVFKRSILNSANLTTALNFNIDPENNRLKKARFAEEGLSGLLKKYDIVVQ